MFLGRFEVYVTNARREDMQSILWRKYGKPDTIVQVEFPTCDGERWEWDIHTGMYDDESMEMLTPEYWLERILSTVRPHIQDHSILYADVFTLEHRIDFPTLGSEKDHKVLRRFPT